MARRSFAFAALVASFALIGGCSQGSAPVSPSQAPLVNGAAPDGSTLKATEPGLVSPVGGIRTDSTKPTFRIQNSTGRFVTATFDYRIEVYDENGAFVVNSPKLGAGAGGQTTWAPPSDLALDTRYQWRARAELGTEYGPWSDFGDFVTIDYRGLVPRPPDGNWPTDPDAVVAYVAASFPNYLRPTGSLGERLANMEFLRDRIIEAGVCGGLDVARNLKRGIGPHSHDAIAWRKPNGFVEVVDIAAAFDDWRSTMSLHWSIVEGPSGYDPLPFHPGC